jgi:hypothetical protein
LYLAPDTDTGAAAALGEGVADLCSVWDVCVELVAAGPSVWGGEEMALEKERWASLRVTMSCA